MPVAQYVIARYCPSPYTGEAVNVGVIVHCQEINFLDFRFLESFSKVRSLFGRTDARAIETYVADFLMPSLTEMQDNGERQNFLSTLVERFNGNLQFTPPRATIAEDLERELDSLFETLVAWRAEPHRRTRVVTDPMLRGRVRRELNAYIERGVLERGRAVGSWSSPDFQFRNNGHQGMIYVQSLAKGEGGDIKRYAEQLAGNVFLTRRRLRRQQAAFYAIIQPPTRQDQRRYYRDCLEIIRESDAQPYDVEHLDRFRRQVLDPVVNR